MSTQEQHPEAIALRPVTGSSLQDVMTLGRVFKASGYFKDIRDEAQAVTKILYGREMGFTPIVSIMGIYIIEGKPSLSANLLATLVKRSGKYNYRVVENTATRCAILFRERNDAGQWEDLGETEFTIEEAKIAGVATRDNWRKYPKAMLFARALSAGVRAHCPDVSACPLYVPEELGADVTEDGDVKPESLPQAPPVVKSPISFKKPHSAPPNLGQGSVTTGAQGEAEEPQGADTLPPLREILPTLPPVEELAAQAEALLTAKPASLPEGCVDAGQAANFHIEFKKALPVKLRKDSEKLAHDWLRVQKPPIVDGDGNPTAKAIRKDSFLDVRTAACDYARTYNV